MKGNIVDDTIEDKDEYKEIPSDEKMDPEFVKKINELEKEKENERENYIKQFDNIMYNTNPKNEIYNLGIMMLNFISFSFSDKKTVINNIKDENLKNLITLIVKDKSDERISWEDYINHPFFKSNSPTNYKYEELFHKKDYERETIKIIIIMNNDLILYNDDNDCLYCLLKNKLEYLVSDKLKIKNLIKIDESLFLISIYEEKHINIYKIKQI